MSLRMIPPSMERDRYGDVSVARLNPNEMGAESPPRPSLTQSCRWLQAEVGDPAVAAGGAGEVVAPVIDGAAAVIAAVVPAVAAVVAAVVAAIVAAVVTVAVAAVAGLDDAADPVT